MGDDIFYNNSSFDGNNAAINASDDGAIAPDKTALLPGGTATFANYTSYTKGINGIMVDIAHDPTSGSITAADFTFKVGNTNNTSTWANAPAPSAVVVRPGAGAGGSDRVEITWADGAIQKKWLQITLKADAVTQLSSPDVFYFGNAVGETGNDPTNAIVNLTDVGLTRTHQTGFTAAQINNVYDFNRDGHVNLTDVGLDRTNQSGFTPLNLITPTAPFTGAHLPPGYTADTNLDLTNFGGPTIQNLVFKNFYVAGSAFPASDRTNLDAAMGDSDVRCQPEFRDAAILHKSHHLDRAPSVLLSGAVPTTFGQPDVEAEVLSLYNSGAVNGENLSNFVVNLVLPPSTELTAPGASSFNGLGGYHGSIHPSAGVTVYYAVGVYSQASDPSSPSGQNGIPVFNQSWKDVNATFYHELNEARTDAAVEDSTSFGPPLGWYNPPNSDPSSNTEVGDSPINEAINGGFSLSTIFQEVPLANGSGTVPVQFMYSNILHGPGDVNPNPGQTNPLPTNIHVIPNALFDRPTLSKPGSVQALRPWADCRRRPPFLRRSSSRHRPPPRQRSSSACFPISRFSIELSRPYRKKAHNGPRSFKKTGGHLNF